MTRKHIGIIAGLLMILGAGAYLGARYYIENNARSRIQQWANQTDRISGISYQSLEVGLFSKTVQVTQVSLQINEKESPIAIDRLVLHSFDVNNEIPSFMHVEMQGIHVSRNNSLMKGVAPVMAQLGYADIDANVEYSYRYDPMKKNLDIQQVRIRISDMGQIEVAAQLNNLDLAVVKSLPSNPLMLIALVPAVAISEIKVNYLDYSFIRRLLQLGARQSGQSEDQFVSDIVHRLNLEIQKQKQPAGRDRLLAVQEFIKNPGIIELAISPLEPVPLMRFVMTEDMDQIADMLNVSIKYLKVK